MNELQKYIPSNKFDTDLIISLSKFDYPYYKPILNDLFEWIQDINWPVAREIVPLLVKAGTDVLPAVREILESDDAVWIYWTLEIIKNDFKFNDGQIIINELKNKLIYKIKNPTSAEISEEVVDEIEEIFKKYNIKYNEV